MSLTEATKKIVRLLLPPFLFNIIQFVRHRHAKPFMEYAPDGWKTELTNVTETGWNVAGVVDSYVDKWDAFVQNVQGYGPLGFAHWHPDPGMLRNPLFHNLNITYAYVLALTAHKKSRISVLDWGGALGHYYQIGRAVLPDVELDFHCKEIPLVVEAGKKLNPGVHWYADESCLERTYDLVMITSSLQYIENWADTLRRIIDSVKGYLFLSRLPVVEHGPGFVAIQRFYDTEVLHQQYNKTILLQVVEEAGLCLVREFVVGDSPYIKNAPEQCELCGWLFRR